MVHCRTTTSTAKRGTITTHNESMSISARWLLSQPVASVTHGGVVVRSRLTPPVGDPRDLTMRAHDATLDDVDTTFASFLPLACVLAGWSDHDVHLDGSVPRSAFDAARAVLDYIGRHFHRVPSQLLPSTIVDDPVPAHGASGAALFYTRGIDSASTLIARRDSVTALLGLDWIDPPYADAGQREVWRGTMAAARALDLPLIRLSTDARQVLDQVLSWSHSHAFTLIALAQLVAPRYPHALLSGAHRSDLSPANFGNAPGLVGLWRTANCVVDPVDAADGRTAKTALVASDPHARVHLLVCWQSPGDRNCGECLKCLQTMSHAAAGGVLDALAARFEHPLTVSAVAALAGTALDEATLAVLEELMDDLPVGQLRAAWGHVMASGVAEGRSQS